MGDAENNYYVPFQIKYKYDDPERAFRAETKQCNEFYPVVTNHLEISLNFVIFHEYLAFCSEFSTVFMCRLSFIVPYR